MNYVTQIIQSIRVPNVNEVEKLHAQLKNDNRFELMKLFCLVVKLISHNKRMKLRKKLIM